MADDPKTSKSEDEIEWVSIAEAAERSQQTERNIRLWAVGDAKSKPKFKNVNRLGSGGKAKILLDINEVMEFTKDRAPAEKSTVMIPVSYLDDLKEMMERVAQETARAAVAEKVTEQERERRKDAEKRLEEEHQRAIAIEDQRLELENRLKAAEANERDEMQKQIDELAALVKKQAEDAEKVTEVVDLREGEAPVKKRFFGLIRS